MAPGHVFLACVRKPKLSNMHIQAKTTVVDWSGCGIVEVVPGKVSGVPILRGTRVQADAIVENYEGGSPVEEISENFGIPETTIRGLLTFAAQQQSHLRV